MNISKKNKNFGTLTSHYWFWKNKLKSIEEGEKSINIILDAIRTLKGKILYSITDNYYKTNIKKKNNLKFLL